jgi:hypothetical protein
MYTQFKYSKKLIPKTFEYLENNNLADVSLYVISFIKSQLDIPLTSKEVHVKKDNYFYLYHGISHMDMLYYMKKHATKNPSWYPGVFLDKNLFDQVFSTKKDANTLIGNLEMYMDLCNSGNVSPIENLYSHLTGYNFQSTKKDLNILIELLTLTKDEKFISIFIKHYAVVSSVDPNLATVKINALTEEIKNEAYSEKIRNELIETISEKDDFITDNDNRLTLTLNIEALTKIRAKNKLKNDGFYFVSTVESLLEKMYDKEHPFFSSYIIRTEEKDRIKHYIDSLRYSKRDKVIGESLKSFQFAYNDEADKKRKKEVFMTLFKELAIIDNITEKHLNTTMGKLILTQSLYTSLYKIKASNAGFIILSNFNFILFIVYFMMVKTYLV